MVSSAIKTEFQSQLGYQQKHFFTKKKPYYTTYLWVKNKFCDVGRNYDGSGNEWQWISKIQSHEPYG